MTEYKDLTGLDKAAILFKTLGANLALQMFKGLNKNQLQKIRQHMSSTASVPFEVKKAVLEEFYFSFVTEKFTPAGEETKKPFEYLNDLSDNQIISLIAAESPVIMALTVAQLSVDRQVIVLQNLPPTAQPRVMAEIGHIGDIPLEGVVSIANELKEKAAFLPRASEYSRGGGENVAGILSQMAPKDERRFLEHLEKEAPELVQQVKHFYFTFDDMTKLPQTVVGDVLKSVEASEVAYALKGQPDDIKEFFINSLPQRTQIILQDEMQLLEGPQPRRKVEAAQKKIVDKARELEKEGRFKLEDFMDADFIE
ncbi:MAG: FliG C-terminal domain-containing protein [Candidatus Neomarinimicrobiota bacterium]